MANLGEYLGSGATTTKLLLHLNGNSADSSGNGNNGTDTNITYVDGKFGKCASFNGSSAYITHTIAQPTSAYTLSFWMKHNSGSTDSNRGIWDTQNPASTSTGVVCAYNSSMNKLRVYHNNSSWTETDDLGTLLEDGVFRHIAISWNGTNISFYVDGVLKKSNSYSTSITNWGTARIGNRTTTNNYVDGLIDEFILENRAWSAEEVKKYYTQSRGFYATL